MLGTIQITGEELGDVEVNDICNSLTNDSVRLLSLRGCHVNDTLFKRITDTLKENSSLVQLNLSLGVVCSKQRVKWLCEALKCNKNISSLLLHGNNLTDDGIKCLVNVLQNHPRISSIDVGDCDLTDDGLQQICILLPPDEGNIYLNTLSLTGNKNVTQIGWTYLAIAIAASSKLKNLYLDYNKIGDYGAGVLAVALASSSTIEKVDLEGCGITESGAELLFDVVANYPTSLKEINLLDNDISDELQDQIKQCLKAEGDDEQMDNIA